MQRFLMGYVLIATLAAAALITLGWRSLDSLQGMITSQQQLTDRQQQQYEQSLAELQTSIASMKSDHAEQITKLQQENQRLIEEIQSQAGPSEWNPVTLRFVRGGEDGQPAADVEVTLKPVDTASGLPVMRAVSSESGAVTFLEVKFGQYQLFLATPPRKEGVLSYFHEGLLDVPLGTSLEKTFVTPAHRPEIQRVNLNVDWPEDLPADRILAIAQLSPDTFYVNHSEPSWETNWMQLSGFTTNPPAQASYIGFVQPQGILIHPELGLFEERFPRNMAFRGSRTGSQSRTVTSLISLTPKPRLDLVRWHGENIPFPTVAIGIRPSVSEQVNNFLQRGGVGGGLRESLGTLDEKSPLLKLPEFEVLLPSNGVQNEPIPLQHEAQTSESTSPPGGGRGRFTSDRDQYESLQFIFLDGSQFSTRLEPGDPETVWLIPSEGQVDEVRGLIQQAETRHSQALKALREVEATTAGGSND